MVAILRKAQYITIAMSSDNEPYLVALSRGYDAVNNCVYFHCARDGKKIDILRENNVIWGQALVDYGYVIGKCDHLYSTVHFKGVVRFLQDVWGEKNGMLS